MSTTTTTTTTTTAINSTKASSSTSTSFASSSSLFRPRPVAPSSPPPPLLLTQRSNSAKRSFYNDGYQRFGDQRRGRGRGGGSSTFRARPQFASLLGGATLAAGGVVYYSSRETVPYTGRKHSILVSRDLERKLGESTFAQIVADAKAKRALLPRNHPSTLAVERIGRRLAAVASDGEDGENVEGGETEHMKVKKKSESFFFFKLFLFSSSFDARALSFAPELSLCFPPSFLSLSFFPSLFFSCALSLWTHKNLIIFHYL
jgi:hypothetical protein